MKIIMVLIVGIFGVACNNEASVKAEAAAHSFAVTTPFLKFQYAPPKVGTEEALYRLELAAKVHSAHRVVGIIEPKPEYDPSDNYILQPVYSSLTHFIDDMNSQDSTYTWKSYPGVDYSLVFVVPTLGSKLSTLVGNLSFSDNTFCEILEQITDKIDTRPGNGACVLRGSFRSISNEEFDALRVKKHSVSFTAQTTGINAFVSLVEATGIPAGFRVSSPFGKGRVHWVVR